MDTYDLFLYLAGGVVAAVIVYLGGHVSSTKPWHKKAFMTLGIVSFALSAASGVKNYFSGKESAAKTLLAQNGAKDAQTQLKQIEDKNGEKLQKIAEQLDNLNQNVKTPAQKKNWWKSKKNCSTTPPFCTA